MSNQLMTFATRRINEALTRYQQLDEAHAALQNANGNGAKLPKEMIDEVWCYREEAKRDVTRLQQAVERVNWRAAKRKQAA